MKIVIISDVHGNLEALSSLPESFDQLWVLGDLVNYGPNPAEVVDFIQANASIVVRGNHDHAIGFDEDPRCSPPFRRMAEVMQNYSASVLSEDQKQFLASLPLRIDREVESIKVTLCHATPSDPLFTYSPPDSPQWENELGLTKADVLLVGHTHLPFVHYLGQRTIANPGSLGQPKTGNPAACYASWDTDQGHKGIELRTYDYAVETTVAKLHTLPIQPEIADILAHVLRCGAL